MEGSIVRLQKHGSPVQDSLLHPRFPLAGEGRHEFQVENSQGLPGGLTGRAGVAAEDS